MTAFLAFSRPRIFSLSAMRSDGVGSTGTRAQVWRVLHTPATEASLVSGWSYSTAMVMFFKEGSCLLFQLFFYGLHAVVKPHGVVGSAHVFGQRADGDAVHAGLGQRAQAVQRDAT